MALAPRRDAGTAFTAVKFMWSFHVSHLRTYPAMYKRNIQSISRLIGKDQSL